MLASSSTTVMHADAVPEILSLLPTMTDSDFVYLDPPYVHAARRDVNIYRCEMTDDQHRYLVESLLPAMTAGGARWMLSGYRNAMYSEASSLCNAWQHDYTAMTRRGPAIETLWMNYDPGCSIAETTYAGSDFRERERIKRKAARWDAKFAALSAIERRVIMAMLEAAMLDAS